MGVDRCLNLTNTAKERDHEVRTRTRWRRRWRWTRKGRRIHKKTSSSFSDNGINSSCCSCIVVLPVGKGKVGKGDKDKEDKKDECKDEKEGEPKKEEGRRKVRDTEHMEKHKEKEKHCLSCGQRGRDGD